MQREVVEVEDFERAWRAGIGRRRAGVNGGIDNGRSPEADGGPDGVVGGVITAQAISMGR